MSEGGDEILSAGKLSGRATGSDHGRSVIEGMPNVTVGPAGRLTLAYLTRAGRETSWRLCLAELSLEKGTDKPVISACPARCRRSGGRPDPDSADVFERRRGRLRRDRRRRIKKYTLAAFAGRSKPVALD